MSMLFSGSDDKKTSSEWRWEEDGVMAHFRDEHDEVPITRSEWISGSYREPKLLKNESQSSK
jgi:hypothetical protein